MDKFHLPSTLEEAVNYLLPRFNNMEVCFEKSEDHFSAFCHSMISGGIGMQIRNEFGFWTKDTELYTHMVEKYKLDHPDDMSDLIIREVYKKYHTINDKEDQP